MMMMMMMILKIKIPGTPSPPRANDPGGRFSVIWDKTQRSSYCNSYMNKRHSSSALGSSATGRSKRLYLTNDDDDDDDDSEDLCVAEVSGCATTHDNARNKHCR